MSRAVATRRKWRRKLLAFGFIWFAVGTILYCVGVVEPPYVWAAAVAGFNAGWMGESLFGRAS